MLDMGKCILIWEMVVVVVVMIVKVNIIIIIIIIIVMMVVRIGRGGCWVMDVKIGHGRHTSSPLSRVVRNAIYSIYGTQEIETRCIISSRHDVTTRRI
jgi:hypothetical protein